MQRRSSSWPRTASELARLEQDIDAAGRRHQLTAAIFAALIHSPVYSRDEQGQRHRRALPARWACPIPLANTLKLMASKRRLFVVPQLVAALRGLIADEKGEVTADVRAATALSADQEKNLAATLKSSVGKDVKMNVTVDESLIGGLIVKVGSKMIDTSIRSKLMQPCRIP